MFDYPLSNIPTYNLRMQFKNYLMLLRSERFAAELSGKSQTIELPDFIWKGLPSDLLNLMLKQAILGLESYVSSAVFFECGRRGLLSEPVLAMIKNPFGIKDGGSAVTKIYDLLPSKADKSFGLKSKNSELFAEVCEFYAKVRNPLFHGQQMSAITIDQTLEMFEFIGRVYVWVDSWHDFDRILAESFGSSTRIDLRDE